MSLWSRVNRLESRSPDAPNYPLKRLALQEFSLEELRHIEQAMEPDQEYSLEELRVMLGKPRATERLRASEDKGS